MKIIYSFVFFTFLFQSQNAFAEINKDLSIAAKTNNVAVVKSLITNDANIESTNTKGKTPLIIAAQYNAYEAAKVLVKAGANLNAQDDNGGTPLFYAAENDSVKVAQLLLANGANSTIKNTEGYTPYEIARENGSYLIEKLLLNDRRSVALMLDYEGKAISDDEFKNAAIATLSRRGWQLAEVTTKQVNGVLEKSDFIYKCRIILTDKEIVIRYVNGYGVVKLNYLLNLEGDMRKTLGL